MVIFFIQSYFCDKNLKMVIWENCTYNIIYFWSNNIYRYIDREIWLCWCIKWQLKIDLLNSCRVLAKLWVFSTETSAFFYEITWKISKSQHFRAYLSLCEWQSQEPIKICGNIKAKNIKPNPILIFLDLYINFSSG